MSRLAEGTIPLRVLIDPAQPARLRCPDIETTFELDLTGGSVISPRPLQVAFLRAAVAEHFKSLLQQATEGDPQPLRDFGAALGLKLTKVEDGENTIELRFCLQFGSYAASPTEA